MLVSFGLLSIRLQTKKRHKPDYTIFTEPDKPSTTSIRNLNCHYIKDSKTTVLTLLTQTSLVASHTTYCLNLKDRPIFLMTKEKKKDNVKYMDVEFNISMHCNACERKIATVINKFIGVETFMTDMNNHKVVVTGKIDPKKLLKKLKKKTGKRVKIVAKEEKDEEKDAENENILVIDMEPIGLEDESIFGFNNDWEMEKFMVFSDENPKAICCIS